MGRGVAGSVSGLVGGAGAILDSPYLTQTADAMDATVNDYLPVNPSMKYTNLAGNVMEFTWQPHKEPYQDQQKVDGSPIIFSHEWLHKNPMVAQKTGGPLIIEHAGHRLTFDFETWEKREPP